METTNLEAYIVNNRRLYFISIFLAVAMPFLVLLSPFSIKALEVDNAFTLSGTLITVFALLAGHFANNISNRLKPTGNNFHSASPEFQNALKKYWHHKWMTNLVIAITIIGILIGGYGFLFIKA